MMSKLTHTKMNDRYYQPGVTIGAETRWLDAVCNTFASAVDEARAAARDNGRPVVCWWRREHGTNPGVDGVEDVIDVSTIVGTVEGDADEEVR